MVFLINGPPHSGPPHREAVPRLTLSHPSIGGKAHLLRQQLGVIFQPTHSRVQSCLQTQKDKHRGVLAWQVLSVVVLHWNNVVWRNAQAFRETLQGT